MSLLQLPQGLWQHIGTLLHQQKEQTEQLNRIADELPRLTEAVLALAVGYQQADRQWGVPRENAVQAVASTINEIQHVIRGWQPPADSYRSADLPQVPS